MAQETQKLALYVHVPFCTSKCSYCGFYSIPAAGQDIDRLIEAEFLELELYGLISNFAKTIYIGGGSPSCIGDEQLYKLASGIVKYAGRAEEFTIEVNPAQVSSLQLDMLIELGVNRLSIGVQSFATSDLKFLCRPYSPQQASELVSKARQAGFRNISIDLIFAIPGQTLNGWKDTLSKAVDLGVEHVSAYSLTYEKSTPLYNRMKAGEITPVEESTDVEMYFATADLLGSAGLQQYEISNYARPGFECRHNLCYWLGDQFVGLGPAAASYYGQANTVNVPDVQQYESRIQQGGFAYEQVEKLSTTEYACQAAVLNLRLRKGIDIARYKQQTGFDVFELFGPLISKNRERGLLIVSPSQIYLSREALAVADSVLADFSSIQ